MSPTHRQTQAPHLTGVNRSPSPSRTKQPTVEQLTNKLRHAKQQMTLLQSQLTTYKEDFEAEREEKERLKAAKEELHGQLMRANAEIADIRRMCTQKERENDAVRKQYDQIRGQLTKVCRNLGNDRYKC